jgi:hypothetical protein
MEPLRRRTLVRIGAGTLAVAFAATAAAAAAVSATGRLRAVESRLCPFPLEVAVSRHLDRRNGVEVAGPTTVRLRNVSTGRAVVLEASGSSRLERSTGSLRFSGRQLWLAEGSGVPYLSTLGSGSKLAPDFVVVGSLRRRVVDPCALVAESPPIAARSKAEAPWELPDFPLTRIAAAGMQPLIGKPSRHDHMHVDLIVDGRKVTIPAGIGQAAPEDVGPGPCPPPPESLTIGDCAPGHYFTARVAASPLQTHTSSGILHLQSEQAKPVRLGQFFDEWGVRFDERCLGGYCTGSGKELRVYVNGKRLRADPRQLVLADRQEIAVLYGGPDAFRDVPARYTLRWPSGCGGPGERTCFPGG